MNFITGAGGFLQAVVYGYGGFRIKADGLYFNSTLPPRATKLTLRIHYLGSSIDFEVKVSGVTFTLVSNGPIAPELEVLTDEGVYRLTQGKPVAMEAKNGVVRQHVSRVTFSVSQSVPGLHHNYYKLIINQPWESSNTIFYR